jgi:hypothetical protein
MEILIPMSIHNEKKYFFNQTAIGKSNFLIHKSLITKRNILQQNKIHRI